MKYRFVFAGLAALLLASCASMSEPKLLKPFTKVALVGVTSNAQLYYVGDQPPQPSLLSEAVNVVAGDSQDPTAIDILGERTAGLVKKAEGLLASALKATPELALVPSSELFASAAFGALKDETAQAAVLMKPQGYKFLKTVDASIAGPLAAELGVNGLVVASFTFQKAMDMGMMGTGTLTAQTTLNIFVYDKAGTLVFTKGYIGRSKNTVGVVANIYDLVKYPAVLVDATQVAIDKFSADLMAR